ncbi:MAG: peptide MFS transporter [Planctomycetota bacterium]
MFRSHPKGLWVLFFTEMWERFGFYLLVGIFLLYMQDRERNGLGLGIEESNAIYGTFMALVYLTPFFGGALADRYLGYRRSIQFGGLLMALGYLGVGVLPGMGAFYASLALVVLGNGLFKPNMSALVGGLYPEGSPLKDAGYNIFYMGINIGAFVCNFAAAILRNTYTWGHAFAAAGIGMLIGLATFVLGRGLFAGARDRGDSAAVPPGALRRMALGVFLPAAAAGALGYLVASRVSLGPVLTPVNAAFFAAVLVIAGYYLKLWLGAPREDRGPLGCLLAISGVAVIFWMVFYQNGSTLTMWARDHTNREAGPAWTKVLEDLSMSEVAPESYWENADPARQPPPGAKVVLFSTELFQTINPFFIVVLTPALVGLFGWLRRRGKEPSTPAKIAWGLFVASLSCLVMLAGTIAAGGGKTSWLWLFGYYVAISVGELCLSPMGLSLVSKLAPLHLTAVMMGGWFLATSIGSKLSGVMGGLTERIPVGTVFVVNAAAALLAALGIALAVPRIRRILEEHANRARRA